MSPPQRKRSADLDFEQAQPTSNRRSFRINCIRKVALSTWRFFLRTGGRAPEYISSPRSLASPGNRGPKLGAYSSCSDAQMSKHLRLRISGRHSPVHPDARDTNLIEKPRLELEC